MKLFNKNNHQIEIYKLNKEYVKRLELPIIENFQEKRNDIPVINEEDN